MWDDFRKALPKVAAFLSAAKAWFNELVDTGSLDKAGDKANEVYNRRYDENIGRDTLSRAADYVVDSFRGAREDAKELGQKARRGAERVAGAAARAFGGDGDEPSKAEAQAQQKTEEQRSKEAKQHAAEDAKLKKAQYERGEANSYKALNNALRGGAQLYAHDIKMVLGTLTQEEYGTRTTKSVGIPDVSDIKKCIQKVQEWGKKQKKKDKSFQAFEGNIPAVVKVKDVHYDKECTLDPKRAQSQGQTNARR